MTDQVLTTLYFNPDSPCAFSGAAALQHEARKFGISGKDVSKFLEKQATYTLHKSVRRRFPRNRTVAVGIDTDWQADLSDMQRLSRFNEGFNYLLVCVDVLSKYAWVLPMKTKTASETAKTFEHILKGGRKPWRLYTDKGKEFIGSPFQRMLAKHDIQFIQSESPDVKASIAENFMRIIKTRLWRYFTEHHTKKYISVLPKIVEGLNKRQHRSIKRRPIDVNISNENEVWQTLYGKKNVPVKFRFKTGDKVRMMLKKDTFKQGYLKTFSNEIFTITQRIERNPPVYKLVDWGGEPITGIHYESELVKVHEGDDPVYDIDNILKKRTRNNIKEVYVSWKGYPSKFNSWVPESDVVSKV